MTSGNVQRQRQRHRLLEEQRYRCFYCLEVCVYPTMDHLIPLAVGGHNRLTNKVVACYAHNHMKADLVVPEELWADPLMLQLLFKTGAVKDALVPPEAYKKERHFFKKKAIINLRLAGVPRSSDLFPRVAAACGALGPLPLAPGSAPAARTCASGAQ